jgi:hypothetical protein
MEDDSRADLEHLQSLAEDDDFHAGDLPNFPEVVNVGDILMGTERAELSHAGGAICVTRGRHQGELGG